MQASTFAKCMAHLTGAFAKPVPEGVPRVWAAVFHDVDDETFIRAVRRVAATEKWWPSLAVMAENIVAVRDGLPSAEQAFSQVLSSIREEIAPSAVHQLALDVANDVGWRRIEDRPEESRKAFLDIYAQRCAERATELVERAGLQDGSRAPRLDPEAGSSGEDEEPAADA
ncbi:MAG: hypothetical protein R3F05_18575 [Planctomycetota bacterium]